MGQGESVQAVTHKKGMRYGNSQIVHWLAEHGNDRRLARRITNFYVATTHDNHQKI